MAQSPEEKVKNKQRVALRIIHNGIKMDFSMKRITSWNHLHLKLGLPPVATDGPITFAELKSFLDNQTKELEEKLNGHVSINEQVSKTPGSVSLQQSGSVSVDIHPQPIQKSHDALQPTQQVSVIVSPPIQQTPTTTEPKIVLGVADNYGFTYSPNEEF